MPSPHRGNLPRTPYKKGAGCTQCASRTGWCTDGLCRKGEATEFYPNGDETHLVDVTHERLPESKAECN